MANVLLTPDEVERLTGLPHGAIVLYLALRRFMDYATGQVGIRRKVSWQGLRDELFVEPGPGLTDTGSPSRGQVRRLCGHLERAGLVERHSIEREQLIFFLPNAIRDTLVQNKLGTKSALSRHSQVGTGQQPAKPQKEMFFVLEGATSRHFIQIAQPAEPGTPPVSGSINPLTTFGGDAPPEIGGAPRSARDTDAAREACAAIWRAYSNAYRERYGIPPIRNAKSHAQARQLAQRIGFDEAPGLAAWFVSHDGGWYVRQGHQIGSLLADCEKLRTEWVTGKRMTAARTRQLDQTAANLSAVGEAMDILEKARRKHA
ncbi:MAG: hypothetical protein ACLPXB_03950 [Thiobacillaceae bacterium]